MAPAAQLTITDVPMKETRYMLAGHGRGAHLTRDAGRGRADEDIGQKDDCRARMRHHQQSSLRVAA